MGNFVSAINCQILLRGKLRKRILLCILILLINNTLNRNLLRVKVGTRFTVCPLGIVSVGDSLSDPDMNYKTISLSLLEALPLPVFIVDHSLTICYYNQQSLQLSACSIPPYKTYRSTR